MRRWIAILLICCCFAQLFAGAAAAESGMAVFALDADARCDFVDVSEQAWYYPYAAYAQSLGLVSGVSAGIFAPQKQLTVAEGITFAVRIYEKYHQITSTDHAASGEPWYATYQRRAKSYGILPSGLSMGALLRRDEAAEILGRCLPRKELAERFSMYFLQDVERTNPYYPTILALFNAGVLSGSDAYGTFHPKSNITRAEFTKLMVSLVQPAFRSQSAPTPGSLSFFASSSAGASFSDVSKTAWYYNGISIVQFNGLMSGVGSNHFVPSGTVSVAEALCAAVRLHEMYCNILVDSVPTSGKWYTPYVNRAIDYGILDVIYPDYTVAASRGEIVSFLYAALPSETFTAINAIDGLMDLDRSNPYWQSVLAFFRAGILSGTDEYGTVQANRCITRAELAVILSRIIVPSMRTSFTPKDYICELTYGHSGSGKYPLTAYQIGNGKNVMVLTFAMHGYEDNWLRDGKALVYLADQLYAYLKSQYQTVKNNNWTIYILRCVNPDGLNSGSTNNGPGRCTTYYFQNGVLCYGNGAKGIDINRSFPYRYAIVTDARNFSGTAPLQCAESKALDSFVQNVKGSGKNICIDTHGWNTQIITNGYNRLWSAFREEFPHNNYAALADTKGNFAAYCQYQLGYDACQFELPEGIYSYEDFTKSKHIAAFERVIQNLITTY